MTVQGLTLGIPYSTEYVKKIDKKTLDEVPKLKISENTKGKKPLNGKIWDKVSGAGAKVWGWAKTNKKISIPVAIIAGVLGVAGIAGAAKNKKEELKSFQA